RSSDLDGWLSAFVSELQITSGVPGRHYRLSNERCFSTRSLGQRSSIRRWRRLHVVTPKEIVIAEEQPAVSHHRVNPGFLHRLTALRLVRRRKTAFFVVAV